MSDSPSSQRSYAGVGVAFLALAASLWITMGNWAIALPFAVLAITFVGMAARSGEQTTSISEAASPSADDPTS
jgi:hypothetical protein